MKRMLKYIFSLVLLCGFFLSGFSQEERIRGIRIGYDASRLALYALEPERTGTEVSADFEFMNSLYAVVEYGMQNVLLENDLYNYQLQGNYFRIGIDKNFLKKIEFNQYEMVFGGVRYGYSKYTHAADNISVYDEYWGDYSGGSVAENQAYAHWFELVGGIKGELFRNFFVGWSFRLRYNIAQSKDNPLIPYNIPGFGSTDQGSTIGFNLSVYYRIPLYKVSKKEQTD